MTKTDTNGIRIKPGHTGHQGPHIGPLVYLIVRHDSKMYGPFPDRHSAAWALENLHSCNDYDVKRVPVGSVRLDDVIPMGGAV